MALDAGTIAAVATPPGEGAIAVVRVSGPDAGRIAETVFRRGRGRTRAEGGAQIGMATVQSHRLLHGHVVDPTTGEPVDEVLLAWMRGPRTFTGEDTVEISCHGGPVPVRETLRAVLAAGARPAEPGEFTLRAFLNGRLDLTQAEAVLAVVTARTGDGLRLALADLNGELAARIAPAVRAVTALLAYLDAAADFPDDELPPGDVDGDLATALATLEDVIAGGRTGMLYREGASVALVGRPNVGKSSLLNALLRSDRAIVTPVAGTTRDVIAEAAEIAGVPVTLVDTAGIAETADTIERLGIERSRRAIGTAAAVILVVDGSVPPTKDDLAVARSLRDRGAGGSGGFVVVAVNKRDLPGHADQSPLLDLLPEAPVVFVSTVTGEGLPELETALGALMRGEAAGQAAPALLSARQRAALDRALLSLREADVAHRAGYPIDLLAVDVRAALRALGEITGEDVPASVLAEIFSRFCIGK